MPFLLLRWGETTCGTPASSESIVHHQIHEWILSVGAMILSGICRRTRRKICPTATLSTRNPTWTVLGAKPSLRGKKPAINRFVLWHGLFSCLKSGDCTCAAFHFMHILLFLWLIKCIWSHVILKIITLPSKLLTLGTAMLIVEYTGEIGAYLVPSVMFINFICEKCRGNGESPPPPPTLRKYNKLCSSISHVMNNFYGEDLHHLTPLERYVSSWKIAVEISALQYQCKNR
jgi:hypothetical protein